MCSRGLMGEIIMGTIKKIRSMEMEGLFGQTRPYTMENGKTTSNMAMGNLFIKMAADTKEPGKMENSMALASLLKTKRPRKESGTKEKESTGSPNNQGTKVKILTPSLRMKSMSP